MIQANDVKTGERQETKGHAFASLIRTEAKTHAAIAYQTAVIVRGLVAMMDGMSRAGAVERGPVPWVLEKSAGWGDTAVIMRSGPFRMVMMVSRGPLGGDVEKSRIVHVCGRSTECARGRSRPKILRPQGGQAQARLSRLLSCRGSSFSFCPRSKKLRRKAIAHF